MQPSFPMAPVGRAARGTTWSFIGVMSVLALATSTTSVIGAPPVTRWLTALAWVPGFFVLIRIAARLNHLEVRLDAHDVEVRGDLYSRHVPLSEIRASDVRRVEGEAFKAVEPVLRTNGTGLPGYLGGWFRLRNGEKSFVCLTNASKAVHIPTNLGYSLLLSPDDPDAFVQALLAGA